MPEVSPDLDRVRAELEERYLVKMKDFLDEAEIDPKNHRDWARRALATAEESAVNRMPAALIAAFDRLLWAEQEGFRGFRGYAPGTAEEREAARAVKLRKLGQSHFDLDDMEGARGYYEAAREIYLNRKDEFGLAECDVGLGMIYLSLGNRSSAEQHLTHAANAHGRLTQQDAGVTFDILGDLAYERGDRETARSNWGKALVRYTNAGKRHEGPAQRLMKALRELDA